MIILKAWPVLFLLPLPLLVYFLVPYLNQKTDAALRVPFIGRLEQLQTQTLHPHQKRTRQLLLLTLFWCALLLSAARPTWYGEPVILSSSGRDFLLAVDVSESMKAADFEIGNQRVDRLTAVKSVLSEFIARRTHDRLGLILFGSQAYSQTPLTLDKLTLQKLLQEAAIGIAGPKTAIGDAIGLAIKRLQKEEANSRILILLTDGANTAGELDPIKAAELAKAERLKIYTIGVGATEMNISGIFGFGQRRINPSADLDEATLKAVAQTTGGQYFRAQDTASLQKIYRLLDEIEATEIDSKTVNPQRSLFHYPLALALLLHALLIAHSINLTFGLSHLKHHALFSKHKPKTSSPPGNFEQHNRNFEQHNNLTDNDLSGQTQEAHRA